MNHAQTSCPPRAELVEWFDGVLESRAAERVEHHLDECERCRGALLDWSEQVTPGAGSGATTPSGACLDDELLVAYAVSPGKVAATTAAGIEEHLRQCTRCVGALQRTMRLQGQMEDAPDTRTAVAAAEPLRAAAPHVRIGVSKLASQWLENVRALLTPALWPRAALAAVGVLVLAIGVTRFVASRVSIEGDRVRGAERVAAVEITADTASYARPALDEPIVVQLARGTRARWLEAEGEWTRIELEDGRRVWVPRQSVTAAPEEGSSNKAP